jgi:predicted hotdog family 3-hydroxylacyl-ACP dehydratase
MPYPITIESLIPHRDRMKLIDEIVDITDHSAITRTTVSSRLPLYRDGHVDSLIIIEIVAQTAAVHVSWRKDTTGKAGGGLLAGVKNADFFMERVPLQTILTTTVKPLYSADGYTVLEGTVQAEKDLVGRVEIQVIRFEEDPQPDQEGVFKEGV